MHDFPAILPVVVAGLTGMGLGAIFFGGLWWTVRLGVLSRYPARWLFGSLVLRMSIVLAGFYFVGRADWQRLIVCLLGFIVSRQLVLWQTAAPVSRTAVHRSPLELPPPNPSPLRPPPGSGPPSREASRAP